MTCHFNAWLGFSIVEAQINQTILSAFIMQTDACRSVEFLLGMTFVSQTKL